MGPTLCTPLESLALRATSTLLGYSSNAVPRFFGKIYQA